MTTPLSLADLLRPQSEAGVLQWMVLRLAQMGFSVTSWKPGSVAYTLLRGVAAALADRSETVAAIARGANFETSTGLWVDWIASFYGLTRKPATKATTRFRILNGGSSAWTFQPGALRVAAGTVMYVSTNATATTIGAGDDEDVDFVAEESGSAANLSGPSPDLALVTPGPQVTAAWLSAGASLLTSGQEQETDDALKQRCTDQWETLAVYQGATAPTQTAYRYWATSVSGVTRCRVAATGDGGVSIVVAADSGTVGGSEVDLAPSEEPPTGTTTTELVAQALGPFRGVCDHVVITPASVTTIDVTGTIKVLRDAFTGTDAARIAAARTLLERRLRDLGRAIPIGGKVRFSEVMGAIMRPEITARTSRAIVAYTASLQIEAGTADVTLLSDHVAVFDLDAASISLVASDQV